MNTDSLFTCVDIVIFRLKLQPSLTMGNRNSRVVNPNDLRGTRPLTRRMVDEMSPDERHEHTTARLKQHRAVPAKILDREHRGSELEEQIKELQAHGPRKMSSERTKEIKRLTKRWKQLPKDIKREEKFSRKLQADLKLLGTCVEDYSCSSNREFRANLAIRKTDADLRICAGQQGLPCTTQDC